MTPDRRRSPIAGLVAIVLGTVPLPGCKAAGGEPAVQAAPSRSRPEEPRPGAASTVAESTPHGDSARLAVRLLAALPVKPHAPRAGYARDQFGPPWRDVDRNGCDTRDDILRRDLTGTRLAPGSRDCVVAAGRLADPYTGADIAFERGRTSKIDIDHIVALGNAWVTGAAEWGPGQRIALANDPLNLLAVDASANRAKGDGDAATWLPPNEAYHCAYVARQIAVKAKYRLWATADERDAWARVLRRCPDELAPVGDAPIEAPIEPPIDPPIERPAEPHPSRRADGPAPERPAPKSKGADPNYGTCKEAKAHGAGPYQRDRDPEYNYYQDRDGDGVVCE